MVAVIKGLDRALNQVMVVVVGVGDGAAGVAELHLQRNVNVSPRLKNQALAEPAEKQSRQNKPAHDHEREYLI